MGFFMSKHEQEVSHVLVFAIYGLSLVSGLSWRWKSFLKISSSQPAVNQPPMADIGSSGQDPGETVLRKVCYLRSATNTAPTQCENRIDVVCQESFQGKMVYFPMEHVSSSQQFLKCPSVPTGEWFKIFSGCTSLQAVAHIFGMLQRHVEAITTLSFTVSLVTSTPLGNRETWEFPAPTERFGSLFIIL